MTQLPWALLRQILHPLGSNTSTRLRGSVRTNLRIVASLIWHMLFSLWDPVPPPADIEAMHKAAPGWLRRGAGLKAVRAAVRMNAQSGARAGARAGAEAGAGAGAGAGAAGGGRTLAAKAETPGSRFRRLKVMTSSGDVPRDDDDAAAAGSGSGGSGLSFGLKAAMANLGSVAGKVADSVHEATTRVVRDSAGRGADMPRWLLVRCVAQCKHCWRCLPYVPR